MTATLPTDDGLVERLLKSSARQSYDPDVDIDWDAPEVPGLWWMQPERMSLYGTTLWDELSVEQRIELSKHEVASIA
ncbi:MAG: rane protein, partial [Marmoricola sp.]|nr:rane protein [Marmoricola sp.]